jgi:streptogramin lyase
MSALQPFNPAYTQGITVAPNGTAASSTIGVGSKTLCLTNIGTYVCYVRAYLASDGAKTATTADYPVPAGGQVTITKFQDHDSVSYIASGGTGSLHIMPGEGW